MKIAILGDTHFGLKNASEVFLRYQKRFFDEIFFPYCKENGITQIIHEGDFFEHRKYVGVKTLYWVRQFFLEKLAEYGMTMDIIPGNHDVYAKNSNEICSTAEYLTKYPETVHLHMKPTVRDFDGCPIAFLPWVSSDNHTECIDFIKKCAAPILVGHLELSGFEMMKGAPVVSHGWSTDLFRRFEMVLTGHYHTKSTRENIYYTGIPYELNWADCNDPKYFHVLDTETRKLHPVRNPLTIFRKIYYSDSDKKIPDVGGCFVKIIVSSKKDPRKFDSFVSKVQKMNPFDLKIIENFDEFVGSSADDETIDLSDTQSLLDSYVDSLETDLDKERIKKRLSELYIEAQQSDAL